MPRSPERDSTSLVARVASVLASPAGIAKTFASVAFWLVVWQVASAWLAQPLILPGPVEVVRAFWSVVSGAGFWAKVGFSATRILGGLALAYVVACPLAFAASRVPVVSALLKPPLVAIKATPVACVVVLLLIWLGASNVSLVAVLLMALPGLYFAFVTGFSQASPALDELLRVHGVKGVRRALAFVWPEAQPFVLSASQATIGMAWKAGVAAELIGSPLGSIGERIYQAKLLLDTPELFSWTLVVIALASLSELALLELVRASESASFSLALKLGRHWGTREPSPRAPEGCSASGVVLAHSAAQRRALSLTVSPGTRLCVMGRSGLGKTTLLRTLAGLEAPQRGEVSSPRRLSFEFQETRVFGSRTPLENLVLVAGEGWSEQRLQALLREAIPDLDECLPAQSLSGGQLRRLELVRALVAPGACVMLDEPFAGLDEATHRAMCALALRELDGRTLVVATHDARDAEWLDALVYHL